MGLSEGSAIGVFPIHDVSPGEKRRVKILCGSEDSVTKPSDYEIFISGWT